MIVLDVPFIFRTVGGPTALWNLLRRHDPDRPLTYPAVQMWKARGTISAPWIAATVYVMTSKGHPLSTLFIEDNADNMFGVPRPGAAAL